MKKSINLFAIALIGMGVTLTGCKKKSKSVWDDNNTVTSASSRSLWGNDEGNDAQFAGPPSEDFLSLKDEDLKSPFVDNAVPQPTFSPGESGSGLPGFDMFRHPGEKLAHVFQTIYFDTNDYSIVSSEALRHIDRIASYLKENPDTYVYITGNCDERGAEAYNFSLGAKRANSVRSLLVQKGVDPQQLHTISFGKDKPVAFGHNPDAWAKNRRAEFRIYQK